MDEPTRPSSATTDTATGAPGGPTAHPQPDTLDPATDPIDILRWLANRVEGYLTELEALPIPEDLTPAQVETALLTAFTSASRTTTSLARAIEKAADNPQSHAFDEAMAHLQYSLAQTSAQIAALEKRRQLGQLSWEQRQQVQARYRTVLDHLWVAQGREQQQRERYIARWRQRTEAAQEREIRAQSIQRQREHDQMLKDLKKGRYHSPLVQEWLQSADGLRQHMGEQGVAEHELDWAASSPGATGISQEHIHPGSDPYNFLFPAAHTTIGTGTNTPGTGNPGSAPDQTGHIAYGPPALECNAPAADLVRISDPYAPAGWRMVPRNQIPKGAQILPPHS
jgi:hypothetical protein